MQKWLSINDLGRIPRNRYTLRILIDLKRPKNENSYCLIRDYFPKGTDFNIISRRELKRVQNDLNERPRKVLDMCTPKEVFYELAIENIAMK